MKKILILGSNSFSGSSFVNFALNKKFKVLGISRSKEKKELNPYRNNKFIKNFQFYKLDINKDLKKIVKLIKEFKPQYIINFTAQGMVHESWKRPADWFETNILSQTKLIELIKNIKHLKIFLNFSTPEVYGDTTSKQISEDFNFNPSTPYAISRACFDTYLLSQKKYFNFPVIITRTANVYGPYQDLYRVLPKIILSALNNNHMQIHGNGSSVRSFIYIDDVCEALLKIISQGKIGETYHISTRKFISIIDLCKLTNKLLNKTNKFKFIKDRIGKDQNYKLNINKITSHIKWKPKTSISTGILKTIDWCSKRNEILKKMKLSYIHKK